MPIRVKKESPPEAGLQRGHYLQGTQSGGLGGDLREVVLSGLDTVSDELAEIFSRSLGARHKRLATRTQQIRLDLDNLVDRLGRNQLVDAGKERLGILVDRLLNVAADL